MDVFLLSLSHGPLAIVLPILWLLSLPASIFAFKRLYKFPSVVSFWARALILATQLLLTVLVFSRALSFPMRSGSCLAKSLRSKFARYLPRYCQVCSGLGRAISDSETMGRSHK